MSLRLDPEQVGKAIVLHDGYEEVSPGLVHCSCTAELRGSGEAHNLWVQHRVATLLKWLDSAGIAIPDVEWGVRFGDSEDNVLSYGSRSEALDSLINIRKGLSESEAAEWHLCRRLSVSRQTRWEPAD